MGLFISSRSANSGTTGGPGERAPFGEQARGLVGLVLHRVVEGVHDALREPARILRGELVGPVVEGEEKVEEVGHVPQPSVACVWVARGGEFTPAQAQKRRAPLRREGGMRLDEKPRLGGASDVRVPRV